MSDTDSPIQIAPTHDSRKLREVFDQYGRLQIPEFLTTPAADAIFNCLSAQKAWNLVYIAAGKHVDSDTRAVAKWPIEQRRKLKKIIHAEAQQGFQYWYASVPIYDIYHRGQMPGFFLNEVLIFLNSPEFLGLMRDVTGEDSITFADAQATRFDAGHFLTCHNDEVGGKNRRVAYVLSLSPVWRPDWGGALQFFGKNGNVEEGYMPNYNSLSVFRVPTDHSVGIVAPFAAASRYSITGWLRSGEDPRQ